jgi:hypothetical protein
MKNVFPFSTGSIVTASFAQTAEFSINAQIAESASFANTAAKILEPELRQGPAGKARCYVTHEQYQQMLTGLFVENCLPPED